MSKWEFNNVCSLYRVKDKPVSCKGAGSGSRDFVNLSPQDWSEKVVWRTVPLLIFNRVSRTKQMWKGRNNSTFVRYNFTGNQ